MVADGADATLYEWILFTYYVYLFCSCLTVLVFFPANVKIEIENSMRNYICLQIWYPGGIESRETVSLMSSFAKESVPVLFYRAKNRGPPLGYNL